MMDDGGQDDNLGAHGRLHCGRSRLLDIRDMVPTTKESSSTYLSRYFSRREGLELRVKE